MRKKLDTRFPAARIKKIMQADEDVGKIAMAVPLLVSKSLELFLQDLCDRTYEVTLQRGAKTMNSLHLKQCVQSFNVFDFLRDIVGKVPDLGGSDAACEERSASKRRKVADDEDNDSDDESKRSRMHRTVHSTHGNGRGRGRGRGRGIIGRTAKRETTVHYENPETDPDIIQHENGKQKENVDLPNNQAEDVDTKDKFAVGQTAEVTIRNFDLNLDLDENGDTLAALAPIPASSSPKALEIKNEEFPGWSLTDVERIEIDSIYLVNLNRGIDEDEEEEDYDEG